MIRWKTDEVVDVLRKALPDATIKTDMAGGDHDTDTIIILLPNDERMWVCGFITDGDFGDNRSDVDVENVELTCGKDSRGGTHGVKDHLLISAHAQAQIALMRMDFDIVACMKDYF